MHNCISKFLKKYKPGENLQKPDEEILNFGRQILPKEIVEHWEDHGFGEYGDGLIKVVDPGEYMNSLYSRLGRSDGSAICAYTNTEKVGSSAGRNAGEIRAASRKGPCLTQICCAPGIPLRRGRICRRIFTR